MGGFSDIGARHYFGQADFFMPELLLNELWPHRAFFIIQSLDINQQC